MTRDAVDRLARLAAGAQPPPIDDGAVERLVDGALAAAGGRGDAMARLARLAADAAPPAIDDAAADRLVSRALASAVARVQPRRWPIVVGGVALAAAVAIVWLARPRPAGEPAPLDVALPTGDHLVGTSGARFEVTRLEPTDRRVQLQAGTLLADVARVAPGQRFEVATAHLVATAVGTVFSVATDGAHSHVEVYEGVVDVAQDGAHHVVTAGDAWSSDAAGVVRVAERPAALVPAIDAAVARHVAARTGSDVGVGARGDVSGDRADVTARDADLHAHDVVARGARDDVRVAVAPGPGDVAGRGAGDGVAARGVRDDVHAHDLAGRGPHDASRGAHDDIATDGTRGATSKTRDDVQAHDVAARGAPDDVATRGARDDVRAGDATAVDLDGLYNRARGELAAGRMQEALAIANDAAARGAATGRWRVLLADALRGLGRTAEAADAFERAASELAGADAIEAGYSGAYLRLKAGGAAPALALLERAQVDAPGSPLEERGLVLHVKLLEALHRRADARPLAERYLRRFARGDARSAMQALLSAK